MHPLQRSGCAHDSDEDRLNRDRTAMRKGDNISTSQYHHAEVFVKRRLILMRHAEAAGGRLVTTDRVRPLTEHGRDQAGRVAKQLEDAQWLPEQVFVSTARRTQETWACMHDRLEQTEGMAGIARQIAPGFYGGRVQDVLLFLGSSAEARTVLALGHNPIWSQLVATLSGQPIFLEPANAVLLERPMVPWAEAMAVEGSWSVSAVLTP